MQRKCAQIYEQNIKRETKLNAKNLASWGGKKKLHDIFNYLEQVHLAHIHTDTVMQIETHTHTAHRNGDSEGQNRCILCGLLGI